MTTAGRAALAQVDLLVCQGADNAYAFTYSRRTGETTTAVDLSTWSAHAQLRTRVGGALWLDLTNTAGGITLDADGSITLLIGHAVTEDPAWNAYAKLDPKTGRPVPSGVWDLELTDGASGSPLRFVEGRVTVSPDVTREDSP